MENSLIALNFYVYMTKNFNIVSMWNGISNFWQLLSGSSIQKGKQKYFFCLFLDMSSNTKGWKKLFLSAKDCSMKNENLSN